MGTCVAGRSPHSTSLPAAAFSCIACSRTPEYTLSDLPTVLCCLGRCSGHLYGKRERLLVSPHKNAIKSPAKIRPEALGLRIDQRTRTAPLSTAPRVPCGEGVCRLNHSLLRPSIRFRDLKVTGVALKLDASLAAQCLRRPYSELVPLSTHHRVLTSYPPRYPCH